MVKGKRELAVIMFCIFLITLVSAGAAADNMFVCDLLSNNVGPKPANTEANGRVTFYLDENKQEITYKLLVEKINDVYMAHLHIGPSGKQGPIAVWLYPFKDHDSTGRMIEGELNGILAEGLIRPEDLEDGIAFTDLIESIRYDYAYVNVHTKEYITGEIRGQVHAQGSASQREENPTAAGTAK